MFGGQDSDMPPGVVEAQIPAEAHPRIGYAVIGVQVDLLVFHAAPKPLSKDIVPPSPFAVHADLDAVCEQHIGEVGAGELAALVGIDDVRPAVAGGRLFDGLDAERFIHGDGDPKTRDIVWGLLDKGLELTLPKLFDFKAPKAATKSHVEIGKTPESNNWAPF